MSNILRLCMLMYVGVTLSSGLRSRMVFLQIILLIGDNNKNCKGSYYTVTYFLTSGITTSEFPSK